MELTNREIELLSHAIQDKIQHVTQAKRNLSEFPDAVRELDASAQELKALNDKLCAKL